MQDETDVDERLARFATAVAAVEELINKARYIDAYELADKKIKELGEQDRLKYLSVLALARLEATEQASDLYDRYELAAQGTEDALSLRARSRRIWRSKNPVTTNPSP